MTNEIEMTLNKTTPAPLADGLYGDEEDKYEIVKNVLHTYVVPIIIITGFVGNTLSFFVFISSSLKRISTSVYIAGLAVSDTGFLFCLGIGWLESLGVTFFHTNGICQTTVYVSFVFGFLSVWLVNAFTMEMYVAIFHPHRSPKLCVPKVARIILGVICTVAVLVYLYVFWIAKLVKIPNVKKKVCLIVPEDASSAMVFSCFDTVMTLVVPFSMILYMITRLLCHITKFYRRDSTTNNNSTVSETVTVENSTTTANPSTRQANEARAKLTRMLVVTVIVFLVLNLPSHAIKVQFLFRYHLSETVQFTETEGLMQVIFQTLYYVNFSINFVLYSACAKSFRNALFRLPRGLCQFSCKNVLKHCPLQKLSLKTEARQDVDNVQNAEQHSRLVDIHLGEIHFSQLPSLESQFVYQSPPCLLRTDMESENLLHLGHRLSRT